MAKHALYSPSATHLHKCLGAQQLCKGIKKSKGGDAAARGSMIHEKVEIAYLAGLDDCTPVMAGHAEDDIELANECLLAANELSHEYGVTFATEQRMETGQYLFPDNPELQDIIFGTSDLSAATEDGLQIIIADYKTGRIPVSPDSIQMRYYALPLLAKYPNAAEVVTIIIQPTVFENGSYIRKHTYSRSEMEAFADERRAFLKESYLGVNPPRQTGDHCTYCPAQIKCREYGDMIFGNGVIESLQAEFDPANISLITHVVKHQKSIIEFIKQAQAVSQDFIRRGIKIDGLKLVRNRATRTWNDTDSVLTLFSELSLDPEIGVPLDVLAPRKLVTPAQAEKLLGKKSVSHLIHRAEGSIQAVSVDDRRKAVDPTSSAFSNVDVDVDDFDL